MTYSLLVVDDDVSIAELMKEMLEIRGFSVDLAYDGYDALRIFQSTPETFDLEKHSGME